MLLASLALVFSVHPCTAQTPSGVDIASAERSLNRGHADEAVAALHTILGGAPQAGAVHLLLCRAYLSEELSAEAVRECEAALATLSGNSAAQDWAGRAYGMGASKAGPLHGFVLARKVRDAFASAVALDPRNGDAANDLSEYYIGAPAVVGGGLDKARALATRLRGSLPQQSHRMLAMAAEKDKDFGTAEREFMAAVNISHRADAWSDLGGFYSRRGDGDKTVDAIHACIAADAARDATLVDAASILNDIHRESELAERLLREYLNGHAQTDAAPAFRVHVLLGKVLLARGNRAAAKLEFESALALASGYVPAKNALKGL